MAYFFIVKILGTFDQKFIILQSFEFRIVGLDPGLDLLAVASDVA